MSESFPTIVRKGGGSDTNTGYWFSYGRGADEIRLNVSDGIDRFIANSNSSIGLTADSWHHVVAVFDREAGTDTGYFYLDGNPIGSESSTQVADNSASGTDDLGIGANASNGVRPWLGYLDEIRISATIRSADWVATEHNNQKTSSNFIKPVGPEEYREIGEV